MAVEMTPAVETAVQPYVRLCRDFLDGRIDATTLVARFEQPYLDDPTPWPREVFAVLDRVFSDAEAYVDSDIERQGSYAAAGPDDLRASATTLVATLSS